MGSLLFNACFKCFFFLQILVVYSLVNVDQLSKKIVNLEELRRLAFYGIPDGAGIRSTVWKVCFS